MLFFSRIQVFEGKEFIAVVKPNQFFFFSKWYQTKHFKEWNFFNIIKICISISLNVYILFRNRAKMSFLIFLWHPRQITCMDEFQSSHKMESWSNSSEFNLPFIFTHKQTHTLRQDRPIMTWNISLENLVLLF